MIEGYQTWKNILIKDVTINNPEGSPGLIFGNSSNPIQNIIFDNVVVVNPGSEPFGMNYYCDGVKNGVVKGNTSPTPSCFV